MGRRVIRRPIRRAVSAALAGYTVITASKQAREMQPFVQRLDRLEERLGPEDGDD
jgi:hypothetical protein